jgi:hypothetical protein
MKDHEIIISKLGSKYYYKVFELSRDGCTHESEFFNTLNETLKDARELVAEHQLNVEWRY